MPQRRSIVLGIATLLLLGVAAFLVVRSRDDTTDFPDSPEHAHAFMCEEDGHTFTLTPKAWQAALQSGKATMGNRINRGPLTAECPQCGKMTARRAPRCPVCGEPRLPDQPCPTCATAEKATPANS